MAKEKPKSYKDMTDAEKDEYKEEREEQKRRMEWGEE